MNEQTNELQLTDETQIVPVAEPSPAIDDEFATLRSENLELKNQLRLRTARDQITKLLTAESARSPELLFDAISPRLDFDADTLKNAADLLTDLKQRFPEQFVLETQPKAPGPSDAAPTRVPTINSGAGRAPNKPQLTKQMLASMKPRDIAALDWNEVRRVLEQ